MNDAQKIERLRFWLAGLVSQKNKAHAGGAQVFLFDSTSVIDSLGGHLNGAVSAGAKDGDGGAEAIGKAMSGGAAWAIGTVGYGPPKDPTR